MIRLIENSTGRLSLIRRARGHEDEVARGGDIWEVIRALYGIGLAALGPQGDDGFPPPRRL